MAAVVSPATINQTPNGFPDTTTTHFSSVPYVATILKRAVGKESVRKQGCFSFKKKGLERLAKITAK